MGKITEQDFEEFHRRLVEARKVGIAPTITFFDKKTQAWSTRIPTLDEVKAHIGLSTNVYGRGKNPGIRAFNARIKRRRKELEPKAECAREFENMGLAKS